ncbi:hypothetical protein Btru_074768 [Bulinus truncatus]|nr:hypothetical protein Btru_074768 [Bulinus truncatus]
MSIKLHYSFLITICFLLTSGNNNSHNFNIQCGVSEEGSEGKIYFKMNNVSSVEEKFVLSKKLNNAVFDDVLECSSTGCSNVAKSRNFEKITWLFNNTSMTGVLTILNTSMEHDGEWRFSQKSKYLTQKNDKFCVFKVYARPTEVNCSLSKSISIDVTCTAITVYKVAKCIFHVVSRKRTEEIIYVQVQYNHSSHSGEGTYFKSHCSVSVPVALGVCIIEVALLSDEGNATISNNTSVFKDCDDEKKEEGNLCLPLSIMSIVVVIGLIVIVKIILLLHKLALVKRKVALNEEHR